MIWISVAQNRKTGPIPTAYVGETRAETEASCAGCALRAGRCYAWRGPQLSFGLLKAQKRAAAAPARYTLTSALTRRVRSARVARIAAVGDPSRVDRVELLRAVHQIRDEGLGVVGYTHFWRDAENEHLSRHLMASCDDLEQADAAHARGWRPAAVLPPGEHGDEPTVRTPGGLRLVVCPAQRKDHVTCNACGFCDAQHPAWRAGKAHGIAFVDHSRAATRAARLSGRRLPTAGVAGASAPVGW